MANEAEYVQRYCRRTGRGARSIARRFPSRWPGPPTPSAARPQLQGPLPFIPSPAPAGRRFNSSTSRACSTGARADAGGERRLQLEGRRPLTARGRRIPARRALVAADKGPHREGGDDAGNALHHGVSSSEKLANNTCQVSKPCAGRPGSLRPKIPTRPDAAGAIPADVPYPGRGKSVEMEA